MQMNISVQMFGGSPINNSDTECSLSLDGIVLDSASNATGVGIVVDHKCNLATKYAQVWAKKDKLFIYTLLKPTDGFFNAAVYDFHSSLYRPTFLPQKVKIVDCLYFSNEYLSKDCGSYRFLA